MPVPSLTYMINWHWCPLFPLMQWEKLIAQCTCEYLPHFRRGKKKNCLSCCWILIFAGSKLWHLIFIEGIFCLLRGANVCVSEDDKEFPVRGHVALEFAKKNNIPIPIHCCCSVSLWSVWQFFFFLMWTKTKKQKTNTWLHKCRARLFSTNINTVKIYLYVL